MNRLLLLRGLAREQRHWQDFPQHLGQICPDLTVHSLDLPGFGTEHQRPSPKQIQDITEDLRFRFEALKEEAPGHWHLLAVSLGGMIGMDWCHRYDEDFRSFIMINSSDASLSRFYERLRPQIYPRMLMSVLDPNWQRRELRNLSFTSNLRNDRESLSQLWAEYSTTAPIKRLNVLRQLLAASRFRIPEKLTTPLLVLSSAADQMVSRVCSERLAQHFSASSKVHPSAGHDLTLDDPLWTSEQIKSWLGSLASR